MKQTILFSILLFLMMQSCVNKESSNDDPFKGVPIVIDIDSVKSVPLTLSHIQYIPLETTDECLIGRTGKVLIRNNKIYVADFSKAMALFVFDMNGKFLFKISQRGQGPGEYLSFHDFDIQSNGDIYMFDQWRKKILIYNSEGNYLREIVSDYHFYNFCLVNNKMYWSKLNEKEMIANLAVYDMIDKKTEFILKDNLHDTGIINYAGFDFYYSPNYTTYYSPKFSKIIYSISEDGVHPAIGIKNLNIPPRFIIDGWSQIENVIERTQLITNSTYFIENIYIFETDRYISIGCIRGDVLDKTLLYNKHSKSTFTAWNPNYYAALGIDQVKGSIGKEFFGVVAFKPHNEFHKKILESREELKNWKEDDNPVIVFFNPDM
jgi:hypothetical protein